MKRNRKEEATVAQKDVVETFEPDPTIYPFGKNANKQSISFDINTINSNLVQEIPEEYSIHHVAERSRIYTKVFEMMASTQLIRLSNEASDILETTIVRAYDDTDYNLNKYVRAILHYTFTPRYVDDYNKYMSVDTMNIPNKLNMVDVRRIYIPIISMIGHCHIGSDYEVTEKHPRPVTFKDALLDIHYYLTFGQNIRDQAIFLSTQEYNILLQKVDKACYDIKNSLDMDVEEKQKFIEAYRYVIKKLSLIASMTCGLTINILANLIKIAYDINGSDCGNIISYAPMEIIDEKSIVPVDYISFHHMNIEGKKQLNKRSTGFVVDSLEDFVTGKREDK